MSKYRIIYPAVEAAILLAFPILDPTYHAHWYQYLFGYLAWFGILGIMNELFNGIKK